MSIKEELIVAQIGQAVTSFEKIVTLSTQMATVLVVASVTVIGYAVSNQIAGIIYLSSLFPIFLIIMAYFANRTMQPIIYTAISLEIQFGGAGTDWLGNTFFSTIISPEYVNKLKEISNMEDQNAKYKELQKINMPIFGINKPLIFIPLILVILVQLILPIILHLYWGWRML